MSTIFLLGAIQGLFLVAVLTGRDRRSTSHRLLAAVMGVFSVDLAMAAYHSAGLDVRWPHAIGLDAAIGFLYGPLWYLYVRTLTVPAGGLRRRDAWHGLPFLALTLFLLPFYAANGAEKISSMQDPDRSVYLTVLRYLAPVKIGLGVVYVVAVLALWRRHRARLTYTYSALDRVQLRWVRNVSLGLVALLAVATLFFVLGDPIHAKPVGLTPDGIFDDLTLLVVTVAVYWIGYLGLRQPEILAPLESATKPLRASPPPEKPRYARSGMDMDTAEQIKERLLTFMEREKPYLQSQLTLVDLASALEISPHNLTEVINTQFGVHFYDFVNGYRVREAQARLVDPAYVHLTVLAIGLESGFNAKSSFNAVFKKHTSRSPSEFRADASRPRGQDHP
jgi:AraC-like DNA-binding protein